jgi:predicted Na+-dependent transporter
MMAAHTQHDVRHAERRVSGWALSGMTFAASMLTLAGIFQLLAGLVAIFNDNFYVVARNYTYNLDVGTWGWIHLIIGAAMLATGLGLFSRNAWAGMTALMLAMLSALSNFFFIPYYAIWALVVIALDVWVIWALTRPGAIET